MIFEKKGRRIIKLKDSLIPMEKRFCFYDQSHTTGTNITHVFSEGVGHSNLQPSALPTVEATSRTP